MAGLLGDILMMASGVHHPKGGLLASNPYATPAMPAGAPEGSDHHTRDRWLALLAGGPKELLRTIMAQDSAKRSSAAYAAEADQLGLTGADRWVFMNNQDKWGDTYVNDHRPMDITGGHSVYRDGKFQTAPLIEKFDDRFGAYDPASGTASYTDPRGPTFQEQTGRQSADETGRHNLQSETVAQGQLGLSRQREGRMRAQGGDNSAMSAIEGELRRRGLLK